MSFFVSKPRHSKMTSPFLIYFSASKPRCSEMSLPFLIYLNRTKCVRGLTPDTFCTRREISLFATLRSL